jgi:hypothetical protein
MSASMANELVYVQYGCGFSAGEGWLNFDSSPTLIIERIPFVGGFVSRRFSGNILRYPSSVRYGDICKGLPIEGGTARGVYASHVLEHLSLDDLRVALFNTYELLAPGGTFRLIVPDLQERAKRYVEGAANESPDAAGIFLSTSGLGQERGPRTLLAHIRQMIGGFKHLWMWDEFSMAAELTKAKFVAIRRCEFGDSAEPMFSRVESRHRFFDEDFQIRECALEARKGR